MVLENVDSQTDEMAGRFGAKIILSFPSGAYGAAAPAMLNYFKPAPAPAKGAPLPAEVQAELNARYTEQLAAKVAEAEKIVSAASAS